MTGHPDAAAAALRYGDVAGRLARLVVACTDRLEAEAAKPEASPEKVARAAGAIARAGVAALQLEAKLKAQAPADDDTDTAETEEADRDDDGAESLAHLPAEHPDVQRALERLARNLECKFGLERGDALGAQGPRTDLGVPGGAGPDPG